jgi:competence protein ComFB
VKNLLEDFVAQEYERLKPPAFCGCAQCRDDVIVFALNRLPPKYVAANVGEVIGNVALHRDQPIADASVVLVEAFRRVGSSPRPGHAGAASSG